MSHLSKQQLIELRTKLNESLHEIKNRLSDNNHYGLEDSLRDTTNELSTVDNHPGDLGTEVYERGKDLALIEHNELQLTRIEAALQKMDDGTYGLCSTCGKPISFERLRAIPETAYCKEHSPQTFHSVARPVEEQFLYPPFGRSSLDEHEYNGFDGEDAWQIVESFGSSNTPAMAEGTDISDYNDMEIEASTELDGFVEPLESFIATDIYGENVCFYRSKRWKQSMEAGDYVDDDELEGGPNTY
ncbi:TraR/DksA C4-type zinc finger protein [Paenibacillus motobuensis]|uniref:YteA family sporulation protein n=1 Tax=Paenibacillus motobuensis TaxID=295324 RepID=A0ABN0YW44_9BACL